MDAGGVRPYIATAMDPVSFVKMHGLGNDFVIIDARERAAPLPPCAIRTIADRRIGVGCDQLIRLEPSITGDAFMRIWNPDGSEAEACGNGTRCVARLLMEETGRDDAGIETQSGLLKARRRGAETFDVDMGRPRFDWRDIPLARPSDTLQVDLGDAAPSLATCVSIGNPHAVLFVEDCDAVDLATTGPLLESHSLFPRRANISLATVETESRVRARVWERGAGATLACGSAACAIAVAGHRRGLTLRHVTVTLPGGDLDLDWRENGHIHMAGPARLVCRGTLMPEITV